MKGLMRVAEKFVIISKILLSFRLLNNTFRLRFESSSAIKLKKSLTSFMILILREF